VPPKRKHLRVYVRMIMTMLRMQKGAKEKKIQRQKQEDDLPDPDDIELFGDFDEGADAASRAVPSTRGPRTSTRVASFSISGPLVTGPCPRRRRDKKGGPDEVG
jgi:hypothetical protein